MVSPCCSCACSSTRFRAAQHGQVGKQKGKAVQDRQCAPFTADIGTVYSRALTGSSNASSSANGSSSACSTTCHQQQRMHPGEPTGSRAKLPGLPRCIGQCGQRGGMVGHPGQRARGCKSGQAGRLEGGGLGRGRVHAWLGGMACGRAASSKRPAAMHDLCVWYG